ncbi:24661_t:CDS:2, partial [Dentiscutata erythropus]
WEKSDVTGGLLGRRHSRLLAESQNQYWSTGGLLGCLMFKGDDRKIAKDWDKERKSDKMKASSININNSTISGSGIGTVERGVFTSVLQNKRDQEAIRAIASQHDPPYEVPSFSSDSKFITTPTNADIDVAKIIDSIPDDRPEDATIDDAEKITSDRLLQKKWKKCLSFIMYVKEEMSKYINCTSQVWKDAFALTPVTLPISLLTDRKVLREKWRQNWAKCDASMTEREANIFECVQLVTRNLANGESSSSKERRKSDEIKLPCAANNVINHALIKLGELMKGSLDSLYERFGYSQCSET